MTVLEYLGGVANVKPISNVRVYKNVLDIKGDTSTQPVKSQEKTLTV